MSKKHKRKKTSSDAFYNPFRDLDQQLAIKTRPAQRKNDLPRAKLDESEPWEETAVFLEAMADVVPLNRNKPERVPPSPPTKVFPRFLAREEMEVYEHLVDLVAGYGPFELTYSDEYVDGAVVGLSPEILKKLRNGEFSWQDFIDLHGCTRRQAQEVITQFICESFARKYRCLLIVSGRGLNSRDREPVLKRHLVSWLTRAPLKRLVLAFASARSWDGGAGAFYVLLRKNKGKTPFICPAL